MTVLYNTFGDMEYSLLCPTNIHILLSNKYELIRKLKMSLTLFSYQPCQSILVNYK